MSSNGSGTASLDPQIGRLIDEHLLAMRRVLVARLMAALDAYMAKVNVRLDQMMVEIEDALEGDNEDEEEDPFADARKRRRG
jgi:hypothetical protein